MAKFKINIGTPQAPIWLILDSNNSDTLDGKHATDFMPKLSGAELPVADESYRGKVFNKEGSAGNLDEPYICIKNATDIYEWKKLTLT